MTDILTDIRDAIGYLTDHPDWGTTITLQAGSITIILRRDR